MQVLVAEALPAAEALLAEEVAEEVLPAGKVLVAGIDRQKQPPN